MACIICGKSSCTSFFHSLQEQQEFESKTGRHTPPLEALGFELADLVTAYAEDVNNQSLFERMVEKADELKAKR